MVFSNIAIFLMCVSYCNNFIMLFVADVCNKNFTGWAGN